MNKIKTIETIKSSLNSIYMKAFDWILALSTTAYGVYLLSNNGINTLSSIVLISGLIGFVLAYFRPSELMEKWVKTKIMNGKNSKEF